MLAETQAIQLSQLLAAWAKRSGFSVTPSRHALALLRLKQCNVMSLEDPRSGSIVGPLVCQTAGSQRDFQQWWPKALRQGVELRMIEPAVAVPERPDLLKGWGVICVATVLLSGLAIAYWYPIQGLACHYKPASVLLNCPISEEPAEPPILEAVPLPPPVCESECGVYPTPVSVPVKVGTRQPLPVFLEADLDKIQDSQKNTQLLYFSALTLFSGVLAWFYVSRLRKNLDQTSTRQKTAKEVLSQITLDSSPALFVNRLRRQTLAGLQYQAAGKPRLHVRNTVRASSQCGYPSLAFQLPQRRREFILVVPCWRQGDWRGQYFSTLADELSQYDIAMSVWHYQHYPTSLYKAGQPSVRTSLFTLHSQHPLAMLIVGVNEEAVFHPIYQIRLAWTRHLQTVPNHLLWFDTPLSVEGAEVLRLGHLNVVEFSEYTGTDALFAALQSGDNPESASSLNKKTDAMLSLRTCSWYQLPESLQHLGDPSVAHNVPEPEEISRLLNWLRWVLGGEAFTLLCASAVYPRPDWRLTRLLAAILATRGRLDNEPGLSRDALHNETLLPSLTNGSLTVLRRLAQLPWLQHGYFPLWLRLALIDQLGSQQEARVSNAYRTLLSRSDQGQHVSVYDLEIDVPQSGYRAWLDGLRGKGVLQDVLFASVLSRRGSFRFSRRLSRLVRRAHLRWNVRWMQTLAIVIAMLITGLLSWFGLAWLIPGTTDTRDAAVAKRFGLNRQVTVVIEHTEQTRASAEQVAYALKSFAYSVVLETVDNGTSLQQPSAFDSYDDIAISPFDSRSEAPEQTNRLSVPVAHEALLKRVVQWALYDLPVDTFVNSPTPGEARLQLLEPLMSRQVFSDRFPSNTDTVLPQVEGSTEFEVVTGQSVTRLAESLETGGAAIEPPEMVSLPPGNFRMGGEPVAMDAGESALPVHDVQIAAFEMGRYEVTWGEWWLCQEAGGCPVLDQPEWLSAFDREVKAKHPVVNVSKTWALQYIEWLNEQLGDQYRLPSEAEWEYAARAGTQWRYSWGDSVGNGNARCDGCEVGTRALGTAPVGSYPDNAWQLFDMHGNVWEWVEDCWHSDYTGAPASGRSWTDGCTEMETSVVRGGAWDDLVLVSVWYRDRFVVDGAVNDVGFRLAKSAP